MPIAAIIGGSGRMGTWFANFLATNGYEIVIYDKKERAARRLARKRGFRFANSETQAAELSDITILATPTHTTKTLLPKIASRTSRSKLLVEISSTKQPLQGTIQALVRRGFKILSIHPMFGPGTKSLVGKAVIVTQDPLEARLAKDFLTVLKCKGARIVRSDLRRHDRMVATTLSLPHLVNFAFIQTLRRSGLSFTEARAVGGTTFKLQLLVAEALYRESIHNEISILADNEYSSAVFATFAQQINRIRNATHTGSRSVLVNQLKKESAYVKKDKLFRTAYERFTRAAEIADPDGDSNLLC